ncbi:MAG: GntR family transcriptional regulator [Clostridia bacterium]|nr:GntR family transcriptional regulator [Clostridia bacterium]
MYIDKKSPIPVYFQLKKIILDKISHGEYSQDSLIPSERELSENLGISRMTVRQALSQLVAEGVLYREKGKGTFVAKSKLEQRNIMSFSDTVSKRGMAPSTKVLYFSKGSVDEEILDILGLKENEQVYHLRRLRLANNIPVGIEEDFIPEKYFPNLEKYDLTGSLYSIIKEEYSHSINYVDNVVEAVKPSRDQKDLLNIPANIPVLKISGLMHSDSGLKLLYEKSVYRSDEYKYNIRVYANRD